MDSVTASRGRGSAGAGRASGLAGPVGRCGRWLSGVERRIQRRVMRRFACGSQSHGRRSAKGAPCYPSCARQSSLRRSRTAHRRPAFRPRQGGQEVRPIRVISKDGRPRDPPPSHGAGFPAHRGVVPAAWRPRRSHSPPCPNNGCAADPIVRKLITAAAPLMSRTAPVHPIVGQRQNAATAR